jgi:threonine dehydrogenase-like Zn-dependent dehydrogenase
VAGFAVGEGVHLPLPHRETHTFVAAGMAAIGVEPLADLEPERAALLQSTGIALQALHDARVKVGDVVVIFGLGALGLLAMQLARLAGAAVVVAVDPLEARRHLAEKTGATLTLDPTAGDVGLRLREWDGADVAIEFSGVYAALLGSGALDVGAFITHRFPFALAADAYALIDKHPEEVLKVVLEYP